MTQWAFDRSLRSVDADGHMRVEMSRISKANICPYKGSEIPNWQGLGLDPDRYYRLFRDPRELERGASTFDGKPLLIRHVPVTAELPRKELWCGSVGVCSFEAPYLVTRPLTVLTKEARDLIDSQKQRELSSAYRYDAEMVPGSYGGESYDGRMVNIRGNHVAIVVEGRAGHDVHVADELPPEFHPMKYPKIVAAVTDVLKARGLTLDAGQLVALDGALLAIDDSSGIGETAAKSVMTLDAREAALDEREEAADAADERRAADQAAADAREEEADKDKDDEPARDRRKARGDRKHARDESMKACGDRKKARGDRKAARDKRAADAAGRHVSQNMDDKVDHRKDFDPIKAKDEITEQVKKDLQAQYSKAAVARETVRPIVGVVSMALDSADEIYAFALKQAGVETKDVNPSAFPAMLQLVLKQRGAPGGGGGLATDARPPARRDLDSMLGLTAAA